MTVVVTQLLEEQIVGEVEEETDESGEDDPPLGDDSPSIVLTFEVIQGGYVWTTEEAFVKETPQKSPKSYNPKRKGNVENPLVEEKKRALLCRTLPLIDISQPSSSSPRGTDDLWPNKSPTSAKINSSTPKDASKGVTTKTTMATPQIMPKYLPVDLDYNIIKDLKKTQANISLFELWKLSTQSELITKAFAFYPTPIKSTASNKGNSIGRSPTMVDLQELVNAANTNSRGSTPTFFLTFEMFNFNVHNYLADFGTITNVMP